MRNMLEEVASQWASQWGLTVSLSKTKLLVVNGSVDCDDLQPLFIGGATVEVVSDFRYLGAVVESKGEIMEDVEKSIARASKAFGALCRPVFRNSTLSLATKRMVYRAVVLGVLSMEHQQESCNTEVGISKQQVSKTDNGDHKSPTTYQTHHKFTSQKAVWFGGNL